MPRTIFVVAKDSFIHWLVGCSVVVVIAAAVSGCPSNDSSVLQAISKQCNSDAADSCAPPKLLGQLVQSQPLDPASAITERYFGANGDLVQADHGAYVIEIDRRAMSDAELWLLTEPLSTPQQVSDRAICTMPNGIGTSACASVPVLPDSSGGDISTKSTFSPAVRAQALVQINGFTFDGPNPQANPKEPSNAAHPTTRTYESGYKVSPYALQISQSGKFDSPEYIMAFDPYSGSGLSARLIAPPASCNLGGLYNAFGDTWPLMVDSECRCDHHPGQPAGNDTTAFSVIGYSANAVVMMIAFPPYNSAPQLCALLSKLQVTDAVQLDSGPSAGMLLNSGMAFVGSPDGKVTSGPTTIGKATELVPYHLALVTLDGGGHLQNADFEAPVIKEPDGRHAITASDSPSYRAFGWTIGTATAGAPGPNVFIYTRFDPSRPTPSPERPVDSGDQAVSLRPGNFISQSLDLPNDRYCMLRFSHGYNMANPSCADNASPSESTLEVSANQEHPLKARFHAAANQLLEPAMLRIVTSSGGPTAIRFTAAMTDPDPNGNPHPYNANCEVLIDNVRLECAK